mmetsp:Transcript_65601/g.148030  ORF Transcript_65601/g.148030 Transcript_65601/m.148030 type:complete len:280 (-) Transcript_65601:724-1563(-)
MLLSLRCPDSRKRASLRHTSMLTMFPLRSRLRSFGDLVKIDSNCSKAESPSRFEERSRAVRCAAREAAASTTRPKSESSTAQPLRSSRRLKLSWAPYSRAKASKTPNWFAMERILAARCSPSVCCLSAGRGISLNSASDEASSRLRRAPSTWAASPSALALSSSRSLRAARASDSASAFRASTSSSLSTTTCFFLASKAELTSLYLATTPSRFLPSSSICPDSSLAWASFSLPCASNLATSSACARRRASVSLSLACSSAMRSWRRPWRWSLRSPSCSA